MLQYQLNGDFLLESGKVLSGLRLGYTTYGKINTKRNNVIWIFHALTANSDPDEWWPGLVGGGKIFDPEKYFIICVNMPGSCYGSSGPLDRRFENGSPYYRDFPMFTTRDMVRAYKHLADTLGIETIRIGIGGSMGGQQLLEWAIEEPHRFEHIIPLATNAFHSPWGIAWNTSQRMCIEADPTWNDKHDNAGINGMKIARSIALISYRHYQTYLETQSENNLDQLSGYKSSTYQIYQGEKLAKRFNAFSYHILSQSMDAHHVGRKRGGTENALKKIKAKATVISIESDMLFPPAEQEFLATHTPDATLHRIQSHYGHDGFLLEYEQIAAIIRSII